MRNWSIVTKIVVSACGIVSVLLLLGSVVVIRTEIRIVTLFIDEHLAKIYQTIDDREQQQRNSLLNTVEFNTEILSEAGAIYLLNWDDEHLKDSLLRPYMNSPELLAIRVLDGDGEPFAAAWKAPDVTLAVELPDNLSLDEALSYRLDSFYDEEYVGSFQVYYTDAMLVEQIREIKAETVVESETFHARSRSRLNEIFISRSVGISAILLIQVICLIVLLRRFVLHPVLTVSEIARRLSELDLTVQVKITRNDELGTLMQAINAMVRSFSDVVQQVQHSGHQVSSSSAQLSAAAKEQEIIMSHQTTSLAEVISLVQGISDTTIQLAPTMQKVAAMSQETAGFASSGRTHLLRMEAAIQEMGDSSQSISGKLETIHEKADNISTIVTTIDKVSEQTNLLSLNAAIEAEKAGEYGRGFAVVAREIRRLADRTAVSTLNIERMVKEMQSAVAAGVMEMDKFIADVGNRVADVADISTHLTQIIEQVQALSPNFDAVNAAIGLQSDNAQHINTAMLDLGEEAQQTLESLRESFSAIGQLNDAAQGLHDKVSCFNVNQETSPEK